MGPRALMILAILLVPLSLHADGGLARLVVESGEFRLTVFSSPTPLRAGPVDLSVLVQERGTLDPVLGARVALRLTPTTGGRSLQIAATRDDSTNRLLYSALFELPDPGRWRVEVEVGDARGTAHASFELSAGPERPAALALWPYWILPLLAIAIFGLHQWRSQKLRRLNPGWVG